MKCTFATVHPVFCISPWVLLSSAVTASRPFNRFPIFIFFPLLLFLGSWLSLYFPRLFLQFSGFPSFVLAPILAFVFVFVEASVDKKPHQSDFFSDFVCFSFFKHP